MATKPEQRFSLENLLLTCLADLKGARIEYRHACLSLAQAPDNVERKHVVAVLEKEIAQHELTIERLEAAKVAQSEAVTAESQAERIESAQRAAQTVAATSQKISATLSRLVDAFEFTVGPALAELEALQRDRASQSRLVLSSALGRNAVSSNLNGLSILAGDTLTAEALLTAITRAGLGRVGPPLDPFVTVDTPMSLGTTAEALDRFSKQASKLDNFLATIIDQAVNPEPATDDLE